MKKFGLLLFAVTILLAACNDNDGDYAAYRDFVTVRTDTDGGCHFVMDNQKTLYPGDRSRIAGYEATDGQRAILWFNLLPDAAAGYDYNVAAYYIEDIYTASARIVTPDELEALADDPVSLIDAQLSKTHLTLSVAYNVSDNEKHAFHLVRAEAPADQTQDTAGYLYVELRHDKGSDTAGAERGYYISFSLEELQESLKDMNGLRMRVHTRFNGIKQVEIKWR